MGSNDASQPNPGQLDPNLLAAIQGALGSGGGSIAADPLQILQQTLMGMSGRQGLTSQGLTGLLPNWYKKTPQLAQAVTGGTLDPYLPTNDPKTWQVFIGEGAPATTTSTNANVAEHNLGSQGDNTRTVQAVANEPFLWDETQVADAIKKFQKAGIKSVNDFDSLQAAWSGLASRAGAMYSLSSGKNKVTPWDVLDIYKNEISKAGTTPGGSGGFTGTHTQVQKTVSEISQGDAWSSLRQTTQQLLGHDPSDQEVRDFAYRMNSLAAQNPTISKTTGNYQDGMLTNSTTKTSGGFTANDVQHNAYDDAQNDPGYAEFQSATTYYNSMLSALGEIGG